MALNSISFQGIVTRGPQVDPMAKADRAKIQEYADKYDVDVDLLKDTEYADGKKKYTAIVYPEYGSGSAFVKTFNMKFPNESHLYKLDVCEPRDEVPQDLESREIVYEDEVFV